MEVLLAIFFAFIIALVFGYIASSIARVWGHIKSSDPDGASDEYIE
ncbi:MAG: hypothetical protein K0Q47_77 [Sedimentibacter sp.]|jgi:hypothetical protein|nr:hypothetical protein [Sedimentibacter sp.]